MHFIYRMSSNWETLLTRYLPNLTSIPLYQGIQWVPTWKAIPSKGMRGKGNRDGGIFSTFELELNWACFPNVFNLTNSMNTSLSFPTWSQFTRYARDDIVFGSGVEGDNHCRFQPRRPGKG